MMGKQEHYLDTCLNILVKLPVPEGSQKDSSLIYLKREDVRSQFDSIIKTCNIDELRGRFGNMLGIVYLEVEGTTIDGVKYTLNFWPCADCACIGVQKN